MNFKRRCEFADAIQSLKIEDLKNLRDWLKTKPSENCREDKIEIIDVVIAGKETLLRGANRLWL